MIEEMIKKAEERNNNLSYEEKVIDIIYECLADIYCQIEMETDEDKIDFYKSVYDRLSEAVYEVLKC